MHEYLITYKNGTDLFEYIPSKGVCRRRFSVCRDDGRIVFGGRAACFCAYRGPGRTEHAVCADTEGNVYYMSEIDGGWRRHTLIKANGSLFVKEIKIHCFSGGYSLFYTAEHKDKLMLIYCPLSKDALPVPIADVCREHGDFCVCGDEVYYTDESGNLAKSAFMPERALPPEVVTENAHSPHAVKFGGEVHITALSENNILYNSNPIICDKHASCPILIPEAGRLSLMWKSDGFVKYSRLLHGGKWSGAARLIMPENSISLCTVQKGTVFKERYASVTPSGVRIITKL